MATYPEAAIRDPQGLILSIDIGTSQTAICVLVLYKDKNGEGVV